MDYIKLLLTLPIFPQAAEFLIFTVIWWLLAFGIMLYFHGDWKDFFMYFLWAIAISIGLAFFVIPGLIVLAIFLWQHGLINIAAILLGPVGWAIGSTQGWYD